MRLEGEKLGHYRLTRFIQGGGMGEVYLAEDLTLSRQVAIKVMKTEPTLYPDAQASKDAARLFQREMRAISMLDHSHILTLLEAGEQRIASDNVAYMVMPYCPEGSLADWIRRYHSKQPLLPNEVAQVLQQAADALQYAHDQQILHLDVKPSNFLVRRQQDPSQLPNLLLADFGVAKMATTSKLSGTVRGTLEYMAPEQLAGTPVVASDQYALGIMVYELLTGRTPFQGTLPQAIPHMHANVDPKPPSEVNPSLPPALDKAVLRALAKKPQDRFTSVKEFASAFGAVLKPKTAQPPGAKKTSASSYQGSSSSYQFQVAPRHDVRQASGLVSKVMGLLSLSFLFATIGAFVGSVTLSVFGGGIWILFIAGILILFAPRIMLQKPGITLFLLYLFTSIEGMAIGPLLGLYFSLGLGYIVTEAFLITAVTSIMLALYAWVAKTDFSHTRDYLFVGLILIIVTSLVNIIFHSTLMGIVICIVGIGIFCGFTLHHIQKAKYLANTLPNAIRITVSLFLRHI